MVLRLSLLLVMLTLSACGQDESKIFDATAAAKKWESSGRSWREAELLALDKGEKLYHVNCSTCHAQDGNGDNLIGAPALDRSPLVLGQKSDLIARILQGKKGSSMPAFAASLSNEEIADIASYIRNAWGNSSGDLVLEADVAQQR